MTREAEEEDRRGTDLPMGCASETNWRWER